MKPNPTTPRNTPAPETSTPFVEAQRELNGLTAHVERRALLWLAARVPAQVTPDHLTALGFLAMLGAGACYALAGTWLWTLLLANVFLALNWLGDSLDGSLARYRRRLRPRYGFYLDHVVDAFGALFLLGGLAASGLAQAGLVAALLTAYYLLSIHIYLLTYAAGTFKISFGPLGGTELRLLLALANVAAFMQPRLPGLDMALFDVLVGVGTLGLLVLLLSEVRASVRALGAAEPA
jgi:phosphatidylglycerophosphate synthase